MTTKLFSSEVKWKENRAGGAVEEENACVKTFFILFISTSSAAKVRES